MVLPGCGFSRTLIADRRCGGLFKSLSHQRFGEKMLTVTFGSDHVIRHTGAVDIWLGVTGLDCMKNDRLRSPVKSDYVSAIGLAAYTFATCEWQVVWCSEKIRPGSLNKLVGDERTAGRIAKFFLDLTRNMPKSPEREELRSAAAEFARLVEIRNAILHGKPCTGPNGDARLSSGAVLEIGYLEDAADAFTACGIELNRLFNGFLATYVPQ